MIQYPVQNNNEPDLDLAENLLRSFEADIQQFDPFFPNLLYRAAILTCVPESEMDELQLRAIQFSTPNVISYHSKTPDFAATRSALASRLGSDHDAEYDLVTRMCMGCLKANDTFTLNDVDLIMEFLENYMEDVGDIVSAFSQLAQSMRR